MATVPALLLLAGCGGSSGGGGNNSLTVSPGSPSIDTNCTGCNNSSSSGTFEQFTATLSSGGSATFTWNVSGGDANAGPGTITSSGQYTPPPYLTADSVHVTVTAMSSSGASGSATITVTPGFLEPLSPENVALGINGQATITGYIAEAGGSTGINYAVSSTATGSSGGVGTLGSPNCVRSSNAFTHCSVTYSAPATVAATATTYVVGTVGTSSSKAAAEVLVNTAGISSNPASHQAQLGTPVPLGSSGGNNVDYDTQNGKISDCCGGTLGALIQNSGGTQYILSCNHVLARSDQAFTGEMIVQPGLIEDNCVPYGTAGAKVTPVATLYASLPLSSSSTNADAAIAAVNSNAVSSTGAIMELGTLQGNGTLAAAPPGTSCTITSPGTTCVAGKGETAAIGLTVAKSGRTTGLTCASVAAVNLNVQVDYFKDCAESQPYLTKTFTNQIEIEGNQFSDAGDSGSLVVDAANAEPVGLFFAGGVTNTGASVGIANPAPTVLAELGTQQGTAYTFVGAADHPVSCLNYGAGTATAAQGTTLTPTQSALAQQALAQARMLINPSVGILGVATGKSSDHPGEAAVILYVDPAMSVAAPQTVGGVRTEVISATPQSVAAGAAPQFPAQSGSLPPLPASVLNQAIAAKEQVAANLMKQNPAFFGVGVGQSFDNPDEAALVIFVDRRNVPASLPDTIDGLRTRYIVMDRLHVTRSYLGGPIRRQGHCAPHALSGRPGQLDLINFDKLPALNLY